MHFRAVGIATAVLLLAASPAFAAATALDINDPWNPAISSDELNAYEIYNTLYGTTFTSSQDMNGLEVVPDQVFDFGDTALSIDAIARYAGSRQHFGTYQPVGLPGPALSELFYVDTTGFLSIPVQSINPAGQFGFYLDPEGGRGDPFLWYSEEGLNGGEDHMIMLTTPDPNVFLLLWADISFCCPGGSDVDYNDFVVELQVSPIIPEPASMLLLGIGMSLMAARRLRARG